jgi:hypothetical protein
MVKPLSIEPFIRRLPKFIYINQNIIIMTQYKINTPFNGTLILVLVLMNALVAKLGYLKNENWYWAFIITVPLLLIAIWEGRVKKSVTL